MTVPTLDRRAQGWLRYLYRKATTPDDWDRSGEPHPHWDDISDPPMLCWHRFDWFHSAIASHLHDQWLERPDGCHCENTKVWPYCLAGAGLGLQLHDLLRGTDHHEVFRRWWTDVCRDRYLHLGGDELPMGVTLYYDPIVDVHHEVPVMFGMVPALYLAPQEVDGARRLFEAGVTQMGLWDPTAPVLPPGPRSAAMVLWLAREWGLDSLADAMAQAVDGAYEPTWDEVRGEFTWGFGLGEEHPRGQYNGTMSAAQLASEGSWWRLANVGPGSRFEEPTVVGVDFPTVTLSQAWWDADRRQLHVGVEPINEAATGGATSFLVRKLDDPGRWTVDSDGPPARCAVEDGVLRVETTVASHHLVLRDAPEQVRSARR
jgi:hypothetical protein